MPILNYTHTILAPLRELVLQDRIVDIPAIKLKQNTDIHLITSSMSTSAFTQQATSSPKKRVTATFDSIIDFFDDDNNISRTQAVDKISKALGAILENSHSTIVNDIGSVVTDIRATLESKFVQLLKRNKVDDLLDTDSAITEDDYTFLKWEKLRTAAAQNEIIENACSNANLGKQMLSLSNISFIISKLNFAGSTYHDVQLSSESSSDIMESLSKTYVNDTYGITQQRAERLLKVLSSKSAYNAFCTTIQSQMKKSTDIANTTIFLIQLVNDFNAVMSKIKVTLADHVNANSLSIYSTNFESLRKTLYAVQYYCLFNKEVRFKEQLILTKDIINNETYLTFTKKGKTIGDIHNYLKAIYSSTELPAKGIHTDIVSNSDVAERLAIATATNKTNAKFIKSKCLIQAYEYALNEFTKNIMDQNLYNYEDDRSIIQRFSHIAKSRTNQFQGDIGKVDDVLYDLLIRTFYHKDLVATVFKYVSTSVMDLTKSVESIDDDAILEAEVSSSIHILVDYLYDRLTRHTDPYKGYSPHK